MENVKTKILKCPSCGANLVYDPDNCGLVCSHCGHKEKIENKIYNDEKLLKEAKIIPNDWQEETRVFKCSNCGASTVFEDNELSKVCPFCSSSNIVPSDSIPGMKPSSILPFSISEEKAKELYRKWMKSKLYAPREIKKNPPQGFLHGVYLPVYTFDMDTNTVYKGRLGKYHTKTVGTGKNTRTVTEIRYFNISGEEFYHFDDIIVNAGNNIDQSSIDSVGPFKSNLGFKYKLDYIAGFSCEHYTKDLDTGYDDSKKKAKKIIERNILNGYNYDVVDYLDLDTTYDNITYKYIMIPIWFLNYKYNNKEYKVILNGDTGRLKGKYPISPLKVSITILIIIFILVTAYFIYKYVTRDKNPYDEFPNFINTLSNYLLFFHIK